MFITERDISRRNVLKAAALGLGVAAGASVVGCSAPAQNKTTSEAQKSDSGLHTWEQKPEQISDISKEVDTEVVIVGGGYSGCTCALSSAEEGLDVVLIEKSGQVNGNGIGGTGATKSRAMDSYGINVDFAEEKSRWLSVCAGRARGSLVSKFFREDERCMNWLLDLCDENGATYIVTCGCPGKVWHEVDNYHWMFGGDIFEEYGMATFVENMMRIKAEKLGAEFVFNTAAEQLVQDDSGKVTGVIAKAEDGSYVQYNASKGVVLATGDVSYNDEYMEYFVPDLVNAKHIQTIMGNTGDGHNMAAWAGAKLQEGPWATCMDFQGGAMFRGPFLLVNQDGARMANEADWAQYVCHQVLKSGYTEAWSVFDGNWEKDLVDSLQYGGGGFWDTFREVGSSEELAATDNAATVEDGLTSDPDNYKKADTLDELADAMGMDTDQKKAFLETVKRYNQYSENGQDPEFFKDPNLLYPVKEGPFYALRVIPAMLTSMGGVHIDDNFQALDQNDKPIEGLYAIGNCSGDMYEVDYPISLQGNSHGHCLMMGKIMGEYLAGTYKDTLA